MYDKKNKSFTLLILSDVKSKVRKVKISYNFLRFVYVFFIIVMASTVILISNLVLTRERLDDKIAEIERIEYKINYKEVELENLDKKTKEIEAKTKNLEDILKDVEDLDKMVRDITGKGGFEGEVAVYSSDLSADIEMGSDPNEIFYYDSDQEQELDDIDALLDELLNVAPELSEILSRDKENIEDHIYLMEHTPDMRPTWGLITSLFGERRGSHIHKGLDIANSVGTRISATASGVVIFAGWHGGYGRKVIIYHGPGLKDVNYSTVYAHLSKIYVKVGDEVKKDDIIGAMGNTGNSTGPHLHYEVLVNGIPKNPQDFLQ